MQPAYGVRALRACDVVELRLEPTNPYDENALAIFSERGTQLGYVSAERAPLIGKRIKEGEAIAVFQAMHRSGAYIRIRFGGDAPTLPDPVPDVPKRLPPPPARRGRRSERCTIPTRSIRMRMVPNGAPDRSRDTVAGVRRCTQLVADRIGRMPLRCRA